jgi:nucleotide-binding universal stress UspA family protein
MLPIRAILHPTDFSDRSKWAFHLACSLAHDHGARLLVFHAASPVAVAYVEGFVPEPPADFWDQLQSRLREVRPDDPSITVDYLLTEGDPAPEILRAAAQHRCDLIVMGTHGRSGIGRLVLGSVAEEVIRKATCPVISIKAPFAPAEVAQESAAALAVSL